MSLGRVLHLPNAVQESRSKEGEGTGKSKKMMFVAYILLDCEMYVKGLLPSGTSDHVILGYVSSFLYHSSCFSPQLERKIFFSRATVEVCELHIDQVFL